MRTTTQVLCAVEQRPITLMADVLVNETIECRFNSKPSLFQKLTLSTARVHSIECLDMERGKKK